MPEHPPGRGPARRSPPGPDWRWILILGALLIVGGLMAFIKPFAASLTAVAIAGSILTLGGIVQLWIAFQDTGSRGARLVSAILGLLILAFGISLLANPLAGIVSLTLLIAGFFLPPVAVILMAAPILLPIITTAGFDPIWFAVVLTINMEIGLISPPVGLNLYVINGIAPDISLRTILLGSLPFVACMILAIVLLCLFPGLATWLPNLVMGGAI